MIRARFELTGHDPRPVEWPIKHPYWCTGWGDDDTPVIVAYADSVKEIERLWPDAVRPIEFKKVERYEFSGRFPMPEWFAEQEAKAMEESE